jgi:mono/diheme cytochrome c family protein
MRPISRRSWRLALLGVLGLALGAAARAEDGEHERRPSVPLQARYAQECGACHVPYAPGLLPAASWHRLMANLPRHFGTDASLDTAAAREIEPWLVAHAGTLRGVRRDATLPPEDRISRADWFVRQHREVPAATWRHAAVKSASNCAGCHPRADQGNFNEHDVRLPR